MKILDPEHPSNVRISPRRDINPDFEERAAIVEFEGGVPRARAEHLARISGQPPPRFIAAWFFETILDQVGRGFDGHPLTARHPVINASTQRAFASLPLPSKAATMTIPEHLKFADELKFQQAWLHVLCEGATRHSVLTQLMVGRLSAIGALKSRLEDALLTAIQQRPDPRNLRLDVYYGRPLRLSTNRDH